MYMRTIEYVLCVFWHQNIFSSHLHLQINQKASPKSVQNEVCPFLNTKSHIWVNCSTVINQATALSKHVYLFKNNFHPANTITCVLNTNLATYLLMNGVCGKGCCSYQLKRWVFLQIPLNCECKCVICLALEILQNSYRHVDSSLNTFNMCWHMITQYILFFPSLCIFWRSSGIKVSVA